MDFNFCNIILHTLTSVYDDIINKVEMIGRWFAGYLLQVIYNLQTTIVIWCILWKKNRM